jgi:hypothetical protein
MHHQNYRHWHRSDPVRYGGAIVNILDHSVVIRIDDRQVTRSESLAQRVNALPVEMNEIMMTEIIRQNEYRIGHSIIVGHRLLLSADDR